jgi:hypothetical protein
MMDILHHDGPLLSDECVNRGIHTCAHTYEKARQLSNVHTHLPRAHTHSRVVLRLCVSGWGFLVVHLQLVRRRQYPLARPLRHVALRAGDKDVVGVGLPLPTR